MKNIILFAVILILFSSCSNKEKAHEEVSNESTSVTYEGTWKRSFELGVDTLQYVTYNIMNDSIQYIMEGPLPIKYTMYKDTFITKDNRWIGNLGDDYYTVFVKYYNADSISLFKQQFETREEALTRAYPSDTVSGHFSSWYTYYSKQQEQ
ncbi:MAG: hypothetical protein ABFS32_08535 [Bacteroidota bacterium]